MLLSALALAGRPLYPQAAGWMLGPFEKPPGVNPVIAPGAAATFRSPMNDSVVRWEEHATFNPAAVVREGRVFLLYRAEDVTGETKIGGHTSRLGLAESADGLRFTRRSTPVLYPDKDAQARYEWPGGVEDPRLVEAEDGRYVLTYTQWNRQVPRLAVATSLDLVRWTKHGPALDAAGGKYRDLESKSGAILCRVEGSRLVATRVNGKYWMYFNVPDILMATSDDLVHWTPLEDAAGRPVKILSPRPGYFDSWLVEAGPPAVLTDHGVVLLYNAGNSGTYGDPSLPARVYTAGQALFDARNPVKLLARADAPFIRPTEAYERSGQYAFGTTFVEGLVPFQGRWYLYYGTADSRVGVAVWDPRPGSGGHRFSAPVPRGLPLFTQQERQLSAAARPNPLCKPSPFEIPITYSKLTVLDSGEVVYQTSAVAPCVGQVADPPWRLRWEAPSGTTTGFRYTLSAPELEQLKSFLDRADVKGIESFLNAGPGVGDFKIAIARPSATQNIEVLSLMPNHVQLVDNPALIHLICKAKDLARMASRSGELPDWCRVARR
jgi:predicted GH43/DUF377 family glycosyl hydrolase